MTVSNSGPSLCYTINQDPKRNYFLWVFHPKKSLLRPPGFKFLFLPRFRARMHQQGQGQCAQFGVNGVMVKTVKTIILLARPAVCAMNRAFIKKGFVC